MTYTVELEYIGEGWCGEYNAGDPDDVALLRFTVLDADTGEPVDDGSYCTRLPETLDDDDRRLVVEAIGRRIAGKQDIKRICEELSWLDMSDVERLRNSGTEGQR